jgi:SP family sugar:H+ symporter-like MFS transporter
MIVSACLFIMGYAMTWAPGIWILIGETFPTRTRAKQGALSTASNWYGFLFPAMVFPAFIEKQAMEFPPRLLHAIHCFSY